MNNRTSQPTPDHAAPLAPRSRIAALDVLRGVAMLGILPVNIMTSFGVHSMTMHNPALAGPLVGWERAWFLLSHMGFELKMMTLFSVLFGAGVVIFTKADADHAPVGGRTPSASPWLFYRRLLWLGAIGFLHAYVLWYGDILFTYALCALLLYPMRNLRPGVLLAIAIPLIMVAVVIFAGIGGLMLLFREDPASATAASSTLQPGPESVALEFAARTGGEWKFGLSGLLAYWAWNGMYTLQMQFMVFPLFAIWRVFGLMLVGMALLKLNVLNAGRSNRFYALCILVGYGLGVPMQYLGFRFAEQSSFEPFSVYAIWVNATYVASLLIAAGHLGVVMLAIRSRFAARLAEALAAVGRMALSNYLAQTLICISVFNIVGLLGELPRSHLWALTAMIWTLQVFWSMAWLNSFRFGPAEWAWRSLTYWQVQPMRRDEQLA